MLQTFMTDFTVFLIVGLNMDFHHQQKSHQKQSTTHQSFTSWSNEGPLLPAVTLVVVESSSALTGTLSLVQLYHFWRDENLELFQRISLQRWPCHVLSYPFGSCLIVGNPRLSWGKPCVSVSVITVDKEKTHGFTMENIKIAHVGRCSRRKPRCHGCDGCG